ncbi:DUF434 domain-containing protein [Flavilitoribacter nigricans]|uniref:DUF434 domain-containing protein n=1 Tax=Flavilitoribacter nigricans (strain ATCC 23147 / DSM 23189 / NBRC 102662 / NCIMB 1420 / SS-2) TaxID=1122177 RepID=A0A2D0NHZ0_FLAN2|nr:DUF434 domain-containing protein [Flavilitoribacter nigricans]PHN08122.1 hypothetical protein CRP01_02020 [Flavilitoribacter nigricans DSM 23189 = NBRC 102662]
MKKLKLLNTPKRNRGQHPKDASLFGPKSRSAVLEAVEDHSHLLTRGYGTNSALELVGNRYRLNKRQRKAVMRMSASDQELRRRQSKALQAEEIRGQAVAIDGFNLLILLESALSGAYIFPCRDGLYRDISSVHGSYKRVVKTETAITLVGDTLQELGTGPVRWLLDRPISNSGRLKTFLLELSEQNHYHWEVELVFNPDKVLAEGDAVVISSDGWVLDECRHWYNLGRQIVDQHLPEAKMLKL